jgi:hypothetical protein
MRETNSTGSSPFVDGLLPGGNHDEKHCGEIAERRHRLVAIAAEAGSDRRSPFPAAPSNTGVTHVRIGGEGRRRQGGLRCLGESILPYSADPSPILYRGDVTLKMPARSAKWLRRILTVSIWDTPDGNVTCPGCNIAHKAMLVFYYDVMSVNVRKKRFWE